jgi:hypothetical protein
MSVFLSLLEDEDKGAAPASALRALAAGEPDREAFALVPGAPFAYWASPAVQRAFTRLPGFEGEGRTAKGGAGTLDDFRFLRLNWEPPIPPAALLAVTNLVEAGLMARSGVRKGAFCERGRKI